MTHPLRSTGITPLHHYYRAVRPSPAHRYFQPRGCSRLRFSLGIAGQVLTFRTRARLSFAPPTCRMPLGQSQCIPQAYPGRWVAALETQVLAWHKNNPVSQRLATIPGIGPIIATAIAATVADPSVFRSGREFAAWLGLV